MNKLGIYPQFTLMGEYDGKFGRMDLGLLPHSD